MRIFINNVDTYMGNALCADLRRIGGVANRMFGTLKGLSGGQIPPAVRRIVPVGSLFLQSVYEYTREITED